MKNLQDSQHHITRPKSDKSDNINISQSSSIVPLLLESYGVRGGPHHGYIASEDSQMSIRSNSTAFTQVITSPWDPFSSQIAFKDILEEPRAEDHVKELSHSAAVKDFTPQDDFRSDSPTSPESLPQLRYCTTKSQGTPQLRSIERSSLYTTTTTTEASKTSYTLLSHTSDDSDRPLLSHTCNSKSTFLPPATEHNEDFTTSQSWETISASKASTARHSRISAMLRPLTGNTGVLPSSTLLPLVQTSSSSNSSNRHSSNNMKPDQVTNKFFTKHNTRILSISTEELMRMVYESDSSNEDPTQISNQTPKLDQSQIIPSRRSKGVRWNTATGHQPQEDALSDILDSYFARGPYHHDPKDQKTQRSMNKKKSVRDLEKEAARRVFRGSADWQDESKISRFLRGTKDLRA